MASQVANGLRALGFRSGRSHRAVVPEHAALSDRLLRHSQAGRRRRAAATCCSSRARSRFTSRTATRRRCSSSKARRSCRWRRWRGRPATRCRSCRHLVVMTIDPGGAESGRARADARSGDARPAAVLCDARHGPDDTAVILYTSGTTGAVEGRGADAPQHDAQRDGVARHVRAGARPRHRRAQRHAHHACRSSTRPGRPRR